MNNIENVNKPKKYYNTKRRKIVVKKYEQITNISFECNGIKNDIEEDEKIEEMELIDFILKYYPNMSFLIEKK